jgi:inosine-uridine nucleoside N-ribohydrolase
MRHSLTACCLTFTTLTFADGAAAAPTQQSPEPVPVILDTDIGGDIDDTWALAMMLGCPEIDLKLIVTAVDDTHAKTRLTAKILEHIGRTDVPIGTGVKDSDRVLNQKKWLGDYDLKNYPGKVHEDGVQAMIDMINAAKTPIVLCVIGPQTNIGEALRRDPGIATKTRIVTMAGSVHRGYSGKKERSAEYNVRHDVKSAQAVFAAPWPIAMAPLDSCGRLRIGGERYKRVAESKAPLATAVIENYELWKNRGNHPLTSSSILFDTMAAYMTFDEAFCKMETVKLIVDDEGRTVPDENGRPVACAMDFADRAALEELIVDSLTKDRAAAGR